LKYWYLNQFFFSSVDESKLDEYKLHHVLIILHSKKIQVASRIYNWAYTYVLNKAQKKLKICSTNIKLT